jgi:hypothetical protein
MICDLVKKIHVFGSRKAKMTHKKEKAQKCLKVLDVLWRGAGSFFCTLKALKSKTMLLVTWGFWGHDATLFVFIF